jgi:hypothetical protein
MTKDELITSDDILKFCNNNNICYIKTDFFYTGQFMWRGKIHPDKIDDTIVVGHSDYPVTDDISKHFKKIFCVNKSSNSLNTFGIPLGLTNDCDDSPIHRIYGNKNIVIDVIEEEISKNNLAYINFNISNYPTERQYIWDNFSTKDWVKRGKIENTFEGRKNFLRDIKSSKFVFCPRGNGIDTHRLWETLYMNSIPIVKYEDTHHLFTDLPILFINDWNEITEEFLQGKYLEFINKNWNLEKLNLSYWINFIRNTIKKDI